MTNLDTWIESKREEFKEKLGNAADLPGYFTDEWEYVNGKKEAEKYLTSYLDTYTQELVEKVREERENQLRNELKAVFDAGLNHEPLEVNNNTVAQILQSLTTK